MERRRSPVGTSGTDYSSAKLQHLPEKRSRYRAERCLVAMVLMIAEAGPWGGDDEQALC
jgi:hypothetical protein